MQTYKYGYTHAGGFHTDDVLSTVLLKALNPGIKICRVYEIEPKHETQDSIVYDIGYGKYDHHQENRLINDYGNPYCAFGLLWEDFGRLYLKKNHFTKIDKAFHQFREQIVEKINIGDNNGYKLVKYFKENELIKSFNPKWYEVEQNEEAYEINFNKAVEFATMLMENWIRDLYELIEMESIEKNIFEKAVQSMEDGIIVLEERIPWQYHIKKSLWEPMIKLIISKSQRGGYQIISKNPDALSITNHPSLEFVHPSRFMGVARDLRNAMTVAKSLVTY